MPSLFSSIASAEATEQRLERLCSLLTRTYATRYYTQGDALNAIVELFRSGINTDEIRATGKGRNWRVVLLPPIVLSSSKVVL